MLVPSSVNYNGATLEASIQPTSPLASSTSYTALVKGGVTDPRVKDVSGNALASNHTWSFTTGTVDVIPPNVTVNTPASGATGVNISTSVNATFSEAMNVTTINTSTFELYVGGSTGTLVPSSVSYNASTFVATLRPTSPLASSTSYTAVVRGGVTDPRAKDVSGNALASNYTWSFITASGPVCPCSIWATSVIPGTITDNDPGAVELGVKFRSDVNGNVTGSRFYTGPNNTGTHVGSLWSSTGTLLGQVTFTGEGATGWQQATFAAPVAVTAGMTYVASYHTNVGYYSGDTNYFASSGVDNAPLHALRNGIDGGNGVYVYSANPAFPINTWSSSNYWVDVVFTT
jgi:hypothetical protein